MKAQKCCSHCPGILVPPGSNESHECCQPKYVSGNLRVPSLMKHVPECPVRRDIEKDVSEPLPVSRPSHHDQFALARKLHAENLEHQPLPDRVEDSVFELPVSEKSCRILSGKRCCDCYRKESKTSKHGPALGYKEPKTKMDLAICWETPIDPVYEPPRPVHIDGSEGGLAPAIFTLVQPASKSETSVRSGSSRNEEGSQGRCEERGKLKRSENKTIVDEDRKKGCCECLCKGLNGVNISNRVEKQPKRTSFRKCTACEPETFEDDPRLIKSAVGLALGLEKVDHRKNGSRTVVTRPKTPFVRRSFCIDNSASPLNVVNGCKGTNYPEHWRLMSVYQQSYRNPYRRRNSYR